MATKMNSWPLEDFGEIFPMMSIPHIENGHGEFNACNSEGSNSLSPWSTRNSQSSWSYELTYGLPCVVHKLPHEPLSFTRSVEAWSRHNSNIPSANRLYKVLSQIMNWVTNCLNALLSLAVTASRYAASLKNWYMSWYQGKPSSNFASSIKQE